MLQKELQDYMVFFGAAYPIRGTIDFSGTEKKFVYEPWSPDEDVSMAAYVPIPFTELDEAMDEPFVVSDDQKIDLSTIHYQLMELAEVFQAYSLVKASDLRPKNIVVGSIYEWRDEQQRCCLQKDKSDRI